MGKRGKYTQTSVEERKQAVAKYAALQEQHGGYSQSRFVREHLSVPRSTFQQWVTEFGGAAVVVQDDHRT